MNLIMALLAVATISPSVSIALSTEQLVAHAETIAVVTPTSSTARWEGGRIVTYTEATQREKVAGPSLNHRIVIRTLGGQVDGIAQTVDGEAPLSVGRPALIFLGKERDGTLNVVGRAQGLFPLDCKSDNTCILRAPPHLGHLIADTTMKQASVLLPAHLELANTGLAEATARLASLYRRHHAAH